MEVRCPRCNKLFRVSDDKIQGSGVKFGCTRCSSAVKITREDFEHYKSSKDAIPAVASVSTPPGPEPKAPAALKKPVQPAATDAKPVTNSTPKRPVQTADADSDVFDLSEPAAAAAAMGALASGEPAAETNAMDAFDLSEPAAAASAMQEREEEIPAFSQTVPSKPKQAAPVVPAPEPKPEQPSAKVQPKPAPAPQTKPEPAIKTKPEPAPAKPKQEQARPSSPAVPASPAAAAAPAREHHSVPSAADAPAFRPQPPVSPGIGKKAATLVIIFVIIGALAAGARFYLRQSAEKISDSVQQLMSPEGLQVKNPAGAIDAVSQDLIVSGMVENAADKPKPAWLVLVEVYDAQGTVLTKARLVNGKQLYTRRDYEIMARRGENVQGIKMRQLQDQGVAIPALGTVNFEIRVMEPPVGIASFNATLQPFDPVQLLKELAEEQK